MNFKANAERVVNEFLTKEGKVAISNTELAALRKELVDVKANAESNTKKEVAQVANTLKTQYENEIRFMQSEHKAISADHASKIGTLTEQKTFLEKQNEKLYNQLEAERAAGIERARHSAVGYITVGDTTRK